MSASREKKNRQDLASQGIQDPKAIREAEEKAQQRKANRLYGTIAVVFVLVAALLVVVNSGVLERSATAITVDGENYTAAQMNYYYYGIKNSIINSGYSSFYGIDTSVAMDKQNMSDTAKMLLQVTDEGDITWDKMIDEFYGPFHKMVDSAITTQTAKTREVRILGNDPKTGHIVKARIGRYGPMVEIEGNEGEKGRFASLKKGQLIESITLEEALELFALPRDLGQLDGEELMVGIGKYGPYVRYGKSFASLAKTDDPYTIGYDRAVEIVRAHQAAAAAANTPLKSFPEDADMLVKNGRYGPYIAYKGKNYRLPKGAKPEELTLDDCLKIVADSKK